MNRSLFLLLIAVIVFGFNGSCDLMGQEKFGGLCFSAFRDGESPSLQIDSLPSTVEKDVAFASRLTKTIRTYTVQGTSFLIPEFCDRYDVDCIVGAWIGSARWQNDAQIEKLIYLAKQNHRSIKSLLVGNEVLHRGDCTAAQLIDYVQRVKSETNLPIGVAETWRAWHDHPEVAKEVDIVAVQAYPYWEGLPIDGAARYTVDRILEIRKMFPGKKVVLSEFGWPTSGGKLGQAEATPDNAARYLREILPMLNENQIEYFYFSIWDEAWKVGPEGGVGAHWGLYESNGKLKPAFAEFAPKDTRDAPEREARSVLFRLNSDLARNEELLKVAYPPSDAIAKDADVKSEEQVARGPGLQAVRGSGIRIELPTGQDPSKPANQESPEASSKPSESTDEPDAEKSSENTKGDSAAAESTKKSKSIATDTSLGQTVTKPLSDFELFGVCLSLFRDNESPHFGIVPLISELREDAEKAKHLARVVRTYSVSDSFGLIPDLCQELELDCIPGSALGKYPWLNELELEMLIRMGKSGNPRVKAVIVGNEVMHRGDFSLEQYIQYIRRVRSEVKVPVATAELLHTWLEHPELANEVDILGVQIYPYWGGLTIEKAAEDTLLRVQELQRAHPNKRIMLTEFGWPSDGGTLGGAVASPENAARYFKETIPLLNRNNIEYFFFAMTDEQWKKGDEGGPGPHWGFLTSDGQIKPGFEKLLPAKSSYKRTVRKMNFGD